MEWLLTNVSHKKQLGNWAHCEAAVEEQGTGGSDYQGLGDGIGTLALSPSRLPDWRYFHIQDKTGNHDPKGTCVPTQRPFS